MGERKKSIYICGGIRNEKIKLSILIPTYKRNKYVIKAIESALAQRGQQKEKYEVIVCSNNPEDNLEVLTERFRNVPNIFFYRNEQNLGMCGNINQLAFLAKGEYIAYLHDDDFLLPNYLETILEVLDKYPSIDCLIPARYVLYKDDSHRDIRIRKYRTILCDFLYRKELIPIKTEDVFKSGINCFSAPTCGTVFKRGKFLSFGGFDGVRWKYSFDYLSYFEMSKTMKICGLNKVLGIYNATIGATNNTETQIEFFEAEKALMEQNKEDRLVKHFGDARLYKRFRKGSPEIQRAICGQVKHVPKVKMMVYKTLANIYLVLHGLNLDRYLSKKDKERYSYIYK